MRSTTKNSTRELAAEAAGRLASAEVPEPKASAEVLMSELLDIRRGEIPFYGEPLTPGQRKVYEGMISRRLTREPVQRILGYAYFRNLTLELSDETLIPRPDTESVVDVALQRIDRRGHACRVLDIGTGTGAIAISIAQERPGCEIHASDISETALETARRNAQRNGVEVVFYLSDLTENLDELAGGVDVLVSNPPYIESAALTTLQPEVRDHDPQTALDGGLDGLHFYRRILTEAKCLLKPDADIILEVGDGQANDVTRIGDAAGYAAGTTHRDLSGTIRAVSLTLPTERSLH